MPIGNRPAIQEPAFEPVIPLLHTGDRLTRPEFERRFEAMPHLKKAELIEGIVYLPSMVSDDHSGPLFHLTRWLSHFAAATPGIKGGDNCVLRLDLDNAPQPDAFLRILPSHGGSAYIDEDGYIAGASEFIAEVAVSSVSLEMHAKLHVYRRHGVREYVVWRVEDRAIDWFILREGRFEPLLLTSFGLYQSEVLPGLWLDPVALMDGDLLAVIHAVQQGLASPEHTAFVTRLHELAVQTKLSRDRG